MKHLFLRIAGGLLAVLVCTSLVLIGIFPYRPKTLGGWMLLSFASIPIVISLQLYGKLILENPVMQKAQPIARILGRLFGLIIPIGVILGAYYLAKPHLVVWNL